MLLVGSVYLDHPRSKTWYELQLKHLGITTKNFTHMVYLNGTENFYHKSRVIQNSTIADDPQEYHARGLNELISYFKSNSEFSHLLLIDNDCFPVIDWQGKLLEAMNINSYDFAAVCRFENLDTFAHPSVFFTSKEKVGDLCFKKFEQENIIGHNFLEVSPNIKKFFPLIRTNKINYHPILFGIYWNAFYHHGAGSRNLLFRLFYSNYLSGKDFASEEQTLFEELKKDSTKFVQTISNFKLPRKILC